nr:hypothetical protein [Methylomarinum sp. Ch1-1]MDP4522146.1 hypothetical protein [Methylomarinum sp. Ch1-1]
MTCSVCWGEQASASKERQLNQLQRQIKQVDADIGGLKREKERLLRQLQALEVQYGEVARTVKILQDNIGRQRKALQDIGRKMALTQKAIDGQKGELESQIRSAHAMGGGSA